MVFTLKAYNVFLNLENRDKDPYLEAGAEGQGESSDKKKCRPLPPPPPGPLTLLHLPKRGREGCLKSRVINAPKLLTKKGGRELREVTQRQGSLYACGRSC